MSNRPPLPVPQEPKAWLFHQALRLYDMIPRSVRSFIKLVLFQVSPDVPVALSTVWRDASLGAVFTVGASLTFLMGFVVVFVWSAAVGTLRGSDPSRLYFLNDWVNILNFAVLCPLSSGFGAVLICAAVRGWAELKQLRLVSQDQGPHELEGGYRKIFLVLLLVLMTALFSNATFMTENMNPSIYPRTYWYVDHLGADGSRMLGAFGVYYGLLNFCLLLFLLFVAAAFLSHFRLLVDIADSLDGLSAREPISTDMLRMRLTTFTQTYLAGKLVVASLMALAMAWKTSQAQHSTNLVVLGGALTLFGVVFLSIPRYYIESQWMRLRAGSGSTMPASEYADLRAWEIDFVGGSWKPRLVASILDTVIIGGFITSFWL